MLAEVSGEDGECREEVVLPSKVGLAGGGAGEGRGEGVGEGQESTWERGRRRRGRGAGEGRGEGVGEG